MKLLVQSFAKPHSFRVCPAAAPASGFKAYEKQVLNEVRVSLGDSVSGGHVAVAS